MFSVLYKIVVSVSMYLLVLSVMLVLIILIHRPVLLVWWKAVLIVQLLIPIIVPSVIRIMDIMLMDH